jgi:hypothetical protein
MAATCFGFSQSLLQAETEKVFNIQLHIYYNYEKSIHVTTVTINYLLIIFYVIKVALEHKITRMYL